MGDPNVLKRICIDMGRDDQCLRKEMANYNEPAGGHAAIKNLDPAPFPKAGICRDSMVQRFQGCKCAVATLNLRAKVLRKDPLSLLAPPQNLPACRHTCTRVFKGEFED